MITDQKQTGVPDRGAFSTPTRQRAQFVKPNQVTNIGRSGTDQGRHGPAGTMQNTLPRMNPLRPANQSSGTTRPAMQQTTVKAAPSFQASSSSPAPTLSSAPQMMQSPAPVGALPETPPSRLTQVTPPMQQTPDALSSFRSMSREEINSLLDAIATGTLKGTD